MNIGLITLARKGSRRIPGKNFKDFCGRPLIDYTMETMKNLGHDSYVMTDYPEIKAHCKENYPDINIIGMPEEFAQDSHDLMGSLKHVHKIANKDIYVLLQPTSPLRGIDYINDWIADFIKKKVISGATIFGLPNKFYYYVGRPLNFDPKERDGNGCVKDPIFYETGSFYIFKKEVLEEKHILTPPWVLYRDPIGIDLDEPNQWERAETIKEQYWDKRG